MLVGQTPKWLRTLERRMQWLAVPNISILLITLQAAGFLLVSYDSTWLMRLALIPSMVQAEPWRLITFLSLPLSMSPIWVLFTLWFLYFVVNQIENEWGAFKTTLYVLTSILLTIAFSFAFDYPVTNIRHFESTLFLAAATLFPEFEIRLFFAIPAKMKWLAWLTGALVLLELIQSNWVGKLYLVAIYSNFIVFFGPALLSRVRQAARRRRFKGQLRG